MMGGDPLSRQILTKTAQENGGVTAAVRVGSGQAIELKLTDMAVSPLAAPLAPAVASPTVVLKTAPGLKPVKLKAKKLPRRAVDQLKHVVEKKAWAPER